MSDLIIRQAALFSISFLYGGVLGLWYDFFRVLRQKIIHGNHMVHVEDMIFCFGAAGGLFMIFQIYNQGSIRFYVILGSFAGAVLYYFVLSNLAEKVLGFLMEGIMSFIRVLYRLLGKPVKLIVNSFLKSLKNTIRTARIIKSRK